MADNTAALAANIAVRNGNAPETVASTYDLVLVGAANPVAHAFDLTTMRPVCGATVRKNAVLHLFTRHAHLFAGGNNCAGCVTIVGEK